MELHAQHQAGLEVGVPSSGRRIEESPIPVYAEFVDEYFSHRPPPPRKLAKESYIATAEGPILPLVEPRPEKRKILGLRRTTFFLSLIILILLLGAAVGGGVGGALAKKNSSNNSSDPEESQTDGPTSISPSSTSSTGPASPTSPSDTSSTTSSSPTTSSSSTSSSSSDSPTTSSSSSDSPTTSSSSTTSSSTTSSAAAPESTLPTNIAGCPDVNGTTYTSTVGDTSQYYLRVCYTDFTSPPSGEKNGISKFNDCETFEDCIDGCTEYNNNLSEGPRCEAVSWDMLVPLQTCYLKSSTGVIKTYADAARSLGIASAMLIS